MSDSVQSTMDSMVPFLRDYMERNIFSPSEIRSIVIRRRRYEYLLRRTDARKSDYLRYVQDEMKLERLRRLRNKKRRRDLAEEERSEERRRRELGLADEEEDDDETRRKKREERERRWKPSIGDGHIVSHIHRIYSMALLRWGTVDVELHRSHADFARFAGSWTRLGRIYAEALQVHPKDASLWIEAASHEYFGPPPPSLDNDPNYDPSDPSDPRNRGGYGTNFVGGSVRSARVLLQRGLRINPTNRDLWHQSFCLELHYLQKLRGRKAVLAGGGGGPKKRGTDQNKETIHEVDQDNSADGISDNLPRVVYRNAIRAVPDDIPFRLCFVDLCRQFPDTDRIVRDIVRSIEDDFDNEVEAWIARARYAAETAYGTKEINSTATALTTARDFSTTTTAMDGAADDGGVIEERLSYTDATGGRKRKRRTDDGNDDDDDADARDPVRSVLLEAVRRVPTAEMLIRSVRFMIERVHRLGGEENESDGDCDGNENMGEGARLRNRDRRDASFVLRLFDEAFSAAADKDEKASVESNPDVVLARSDILLATCNVRGAIDALRFACLGVGGRGHGSLPAAIGGAGAGAEKGSQDARLWLRWADLLGRIGSHPHPGPKSHSPESVLRVAAERVPLRDPGHVELLAALLRRLLLLQPKPSKLPDAGRGGKKERRRRREEETARMEEAMSVLRRILILAGGSGGGVVVAGGGGGGGGDSTSPSSSGVNPAELCLSHLRRASLDGLDALRDAYGEVLFRSGYARSCSGKDVAEVRYMTEYFESCLSAEKAAAKAATTVKTTTTAARDGGKRDKVARRKDVGRRLGRIYDAAIGYFREGGNAKAANQYEYRKGLDRMVR